MTEYDVATRLRAALESKAETAMALTDTDQELDRLRRQLPGTARNRRLRIAGVAAAAAAAAAIASVLVMQSGSPQKTEPGGDEGWSDSMPAGFPIGTFAHPGTYGRTVLHISSDAQATLTDSRDSTPTGLAMEFHAPNQVRFMVVETSATTLRCDHSTGTFRYVIADNQLMLTPISDPCGQLRIPLAEKPWGPITQTVTASGFPTGTFVQPGVKPVTQLELSPTGAILRRPSELLTSQLTFPAAGHVQFSCHTGPHAPCASPCLYAFHVSGPTLELRLVRKSALCTKDDFLAQAPWRRSH